MAELGRLIIEVQIRRPVIQELALAVQVEIFVAADAPEIIVAVIHGRYIPAAKDRTRVKGLVAQLDVPVDDVSLGVIAEVVGLEARRHRAQGGVEDDVPLLFVEIQTPGPARQRSGRGIDMGVVDVRPLEVVERRHLQAGQGGFRPRDQRPAGPAGQGPGLVPVQERPAVRGQGEGVAHERIGQGRARFQVAQDGRTDETQAAPPVAEFLQAAHGAVIGERLDLGLGAHAGHVDIGVLALGQGADRADGEALSDLAGHLGRAQDGRPIGHVRRAGPGIAALRRPADAAAVEEDRIGPAVGLVGVGAAPAEIVEDARALDEERPLLLVIGLLVADVDDRRIDLDLAEIGIDGQVQGQVALQSGLEVEARVGSPFPAGAERIARHDRLDVRAARGEGRDLQPPAAVDIPDPDQVGEPGNHPALLLGPPGQPGRFVLALDDALEIDAPCVGVPVLESELVEGNAHLDRPAPVVDAGRAVPDPVPNRIGLLVVRKCPVGDRAGRVDREVVAAAAVQVGIDAEIDPVGLDRLVAPAEAGNDELGPRIGHSGGDVEGVFVEGDPDRRLFRFGGAVIGIGLAEAAAAGALPDRLVQDAVDLDRPAGWKGGERSARGAGGGDGGCVLNCKGGGDDEKEGRCQEAQGKTIPAGRSTSRNNRHGALFPAL